MRSPVAVAFIAALVALALAGSGLQKKHTPARLPNSNTMIDGRSIWTPNSAAQAALRRLQNTPPSREALAEIMTRYGANPLAVRLERSLPGSPAYLAAFGQDGFDGGFRVGEVWRPFEQREQKGFVMLNGQPRIVDVSDPKLLRDIRLDPANTLKFLGVTPDKLRCDWPHPAAYEAGPGLIRGGTHFVVSYPILARSTGTTVGIVHVIFQFGDPHWRFYGTSLDFIEKSTPGSSGGPASTDSTKHE